MPAGRPVKPLELKVIQGTDRADRQSPAAPVYQKINRVPAVPTLLKKDKEATALWRRVCAQLVQVKMLDEVNIDLIEIYVTETMIYRQAMDDVQNTGLLVPDDKGILRANPARKMASDCMKNIVQIAREFGLTPSTRQKIITNVAHVAAKKSKKETPNSIGLEMGI